MEHTKFEVLSNIMIERNITLDVLKTLTKEFEMNEIDPGLYKIIKSKYLAKIKSLNIQLSKESRNLECSKCQQTLDDDEPIISCINCGVPFHQKHLDELQIGNESSCSQCGLFFHIIEINDIKSIELKKIEYYYNSRPKISEINVRIDAKPYKLKYKVPQDKKLKKIKKTKNGMKCPNCGQIVSKEWRFCKKCGFLLERNKIKEKKVCQACGTNLNPSWRFCKWCGTPTNL